MAQLSHWCLTFMNSTTHTWITLIWLIAAQNSKEYNRIISISNNNFVVIGITSSNDFIGIYWSYSTDKENENFPIVSTKYERNKVVSFAIVTIILVSDLNDSALLRDIESIDFWQWWKFIQWIMLLWSNPLQILKWSINFT